MLQSSTRDSASSIQGRVAARSGFTLMELLLVVAVIVAVAAIALPTVTRTFSSQALTSAGDRVRTAMGQARVKSIRSGNIHTVCYLPGQPWFQVVALNQLNDQSSSANRRVRQLADGLTTDFEDDLLPANCFFAAGATANDGRSATALADAGANDSIHTILFYPDGSSQDAQLTIQNSAGQAIDVQLRGLTGTASLARRDVTQGSR